MNGKILTIAGSDPSGGAGIQADIKTISALGGYAMAAITALTIQNTQKVYEVHPVDPSIVSAQIRAVLEDILPDAIKVGMMASANIAQNLGQIFAENRDIPLIVDPIILSTSGHCLLEKRGVDILRTDMFPMIDLLTPNLAEAAHLAACDPLYTRDDMCRAGEKLQAMGPKAILVKGGHLAGDILTDILITEEGTFDFSHPMISTKNTHGTGCTLSAAIATGAGQGMTMIDAVARAHQYVYEAIKQAPGYGYGTGPLNHLVRLD